MQRGLPMQYMQVMFYVQLHVNMINKIDDNNIVSCMCYEDDNIQYIPLDVVQPL